MDPSDWIDESAESVAARIVDLIEYQQPKLVSRNGSTVEFTAGIFRLVHNWNVLVQARRGRINVEMQADKVSISYALDTTELLIGSLTFSVIFEIVFLIGGANFFEGIYKSLGLGGFIFLGNYLIASSKFPDYLVMGLYRSLEPNSQLPRRTRARWL